MEKYRRESFLLTSAHELVPRSYDIDELCIEFICRKKLINHTPMVEINVQLLEDNLIENDARETEKQKRNCAI